jgi:hypothetical protein
MNPDNALEQELRRFGAAVSSMRSIAEDVMVRVMEQPLTVRRKRRARALLLVSTAGLAACLAVGITTWILTHGGRPAETAKTDSLRTMPDQTLPAIIPKSESPKTVAPAPSWNQIDTTASLGAGDSTPLGRQPLSMRVAEASAIVRGKMLTLKGDELECELTRVIYGRVDGKVIKIRALPDEQLVRTMLLHQRAQKSKDEVREPSAAEVRAEVLRMNNFEVGREVIFFLRDRSQAGNIAIWLSGGMSFDAPPQFPLDKHEKEIVGVITTGAYFRPDVTPGGLGPYIKASERVVRARLVRIGETSAEWQVSGSLYVASPPGQKPGGSPGKNHPAEAMQPEKPATISVDLAAWRLRAETIVRHRASQQRGATVKEEDIQSEFNRLLKDELMPGREAILFIKPRKPGDLSVYKLIGIRYGDADKANSLDRLDKAIREIIAKGEYRAEYL